MDDFYKLERPEDRPSNNNTKFGDGRVKNINVIGISRGKSYKSKFEDSSLVGFGSDVDPFPISSMFDNNRDLLNWNDSFDRGTTSIASKRTNNHRDNTQTAFLPGLLNPISLHKKLSSTPLVPLFRNNHSQSNSLMHKNRENQCFSDNPVEKVLYVDNLLGDEHSKNVRLDMRIPNGSLRQIQQHKKFPFTSKNDSMSDDKDSSWAISSSQREKYQRPKSRCTTRRTNDEILEGAQMEGMQLDSSEELMLPFGSSLQKSKSYCHSMFRRSDFVKLGCNNGDSANTNSTDRIHFNGNDHSIISFQSGSNYDASLQLRDRNFFGNNNVEFKNTENISKSNSNNMRNVVNSLAVSPINKIQRY
jgi:hypothetical protein